MSDEQLERRVARIERWIEKFEDDINTRFDPDIIEALAESLASWERRLTEFRDCKADAKRDAIWSKHESAYHDYLAGAKAVAKRLLDRGYVITKYNADAEQDEPLDHSRSASKL